jgi:hypothetical protein
MKDRRVPTDPFSILIGSGVYVGSAFQQDARLSDAVGRMLLKCS